MFYIFQIMKNDVQLNLWNFTIILKLSFRYYRGGYGREIVLVYYNEDFLFLFDTRKSPG